MGGLGEVGGSGVIEKQKHIQIKASQHTQKIQQSLCAAIKYIKLLSQ